MQIMWYEVTIIPTLRNTYEILKSFNFNKRVYRKTYIKILLFNSTENYRALFNMK